jgi:hypothetical protein
MPIPILGSAEIARNRFIQGEIEAGLVFAANAIEYQRRNPTLAAPFLANAQDCYSTAINLMGDTWSMQGWPLELETMLDELRRRLDLFHGRKLVSSAAA